MTTGFDTSDFTSTVAVMCACKKCKHYRRVEFKARYNRQYDYRYQDGRTKWVSTDYISPEGEIFFKYLPHQIPFLKCPLCNRFMDCKRINGKVNDSVLCDRRCTGAHGYSCECSCGGANHGIDHAA